MRLILGTLGVIGSIANCDVAVLAWFWFGHPWQHVVPWLLTGAIATWICLEYARSHIKAKAE